MQYAIELFFDQKTESELFYYPKKLAHANLTTKYLEWETRPHITLACFNDIDEKKCIERLKLFAQMQPVLPAYIGSIGMFTDTRTIFASPIMTGSMYRIQRDVHECLKDFNTQGWEWYLPDRWVPHCGLALMSEDNEEAFYQACDFVLRNFKKTNGYFSAIGLVKISFPVKEIFIAELGGEPKCPKHL